MNPEYKIDRHKFFDTEEREKMFVETEKRALLDKAYGRNTWRIRWMLVHLAMNTGLRVSEIAKLEIQNCFIYKKDPYLRVINGKGKKHRDVYIDRDLAKHIQQYFDDNLYTEHKVNESTPVFPGRGGKHPAANTLGLSFKQAVKNAKLSDKLSIHSARHTYAVHLYAKCRDLNYVKRQLGHSQLNMTLLYADILPEDNSRLANTILD